MKKLEQLTQETEKKIIFARFTALGALRKPGLSHFVEIIIAILVAIVVGGTFMMLSNEGMRTLFTDMIGRITSGFSD